MDFHEIVRNAVDSTPLKVANGVGVAIYGSGLIASIQEQANATAVAMAGAFIVVVTSVLQAYRMVCQAKRDERDKDIAQAIAIEKQARESGVDFAKIEGHMEVSGLERAAILEDLKAIKAQLKAIVDVCDACPGRRTNTE